MATSSPGVRAADGTEAMAAPLPVEERVNLLETRMTALEHRIDHLGLDLRAEIRAGDEETRRVLREEMRTGHVMIVTELTEQIEDSRRYTRLLHEDVLGRIRVIGEGLRVQTEKIAGQDERITTLSERMTTLSDKIDAARGETRLMFEQVFLRLDAPRTKPKRKRR